MFCIVACMIAIVISVFSVPLGLGFLVVAAIVDIIGSLE